MWRNRLIRAWRTSEGGRLWLFCGGLALLFLWQGTVGGKVFAPLRLLYHFAPWHTTRPDLTPPAWDVLVWDSVAQFYVWRDLVRTLWLNGEIPLWNPYQLGGMPLLANSQSAPFYLPHLLALPLPTWLAAGWLAWLHMTLAGVGLGLFLRRIGVGLAGSLVGAGVWMFATFFVCWLQMSSVPAVLCWYGWVLWGVEQVRAHGGRMLGALAIPVWLMVMAGHLQFAFYGVLMAGLYALWRVLGDRGVPARLRLRTLGWLGLAVALGIGMATPQLLPTLELASQSHRAAVATEAGYSAYVRTALPLFHWITLWCPDAYGHPRDGSYWGAVHYAELAMGVGAVGLWLAILGVSRRGQGLFWAVLVGLALLLAIGSPLTRLLYFYLPGYSATGSPARVLCLWAFGLAVLTGLGFERRERWGLGLAIWAAGFLVALGLAWSLLPQGVSRTPLLQGVLTSLPVTLGVVALAIGALVAQQRGILSPPLATGALVTLAVLPPFAHGYRYPPVCGA
ncbi:MAG: hypothetical protein KatS3mg021_2619 [Fimbriimonadales bacterium]|nr:MAG: hypothetical protein KatS3mg021_2619 [Fimbriimonadales bacterium]